MPLPLLPILHVVGGGVGVVVIIVDVDVVVVGGGGGGGGVEQMMRCLICLFPVATQAWAIQAKSPHDRTKFMLIHRGERVSG